MPSHSIIDELSGLFLYSIVEKPLTNFSGIGKWSNSFTHPKSSPVATAVPEWLRWAVLTSALSAFLGHIPNTSFPRTLQSMDKYCWSTVPLCGQDSNSPCPRCPNYLGKFLLFYHPFPRRGLEDKAFVDFSADL